MFVRRSAMRKVDTRTHITARQRLSPLTCCQVGHCDSLPILENVGTNPLHNFSCLLSDVLVNRRREAAALHRSNVAALQERNRESLSMSA